ncbi:MAG: hypothetical protein ACLFVR_06055 [Thiohalospira sp.]
MEGDEKVLKKFVTKVKNGQLNIEFENWYNVQRYFNSKSIYYC